MERVDEADEELHDGGKLGEDEDHREERKEAAAH
jgi:hypothetical protein